MMDLIRDSLGFYRNLITLFVVAWSIKSILHIIVDYKLRAKSYKNSYRIGVQPDGSKIIEVQADHDVDLEKINSLANQERPLLEAPDDIKKAS